MIIKNAKFDKALFSEDDLYIFAIGYEHRSFYLCDQLMSRFESLKPVVFVLNDYEKYSHSLLKVKELKSKSIPLHVEKYQDFRDVQDKIVKNVQSRISSTEAITVHIDYSSMPRSWYCKLPILLKDIIRPNDKVYFWYAEGEYPASHEEYPSSGIDSFSFFSGKPSLQIANNRIHVVALGYDIIRTQAILSITDPSYLVACYAYNPERDGFLESLSQVNTPIFSRAAITVPLHIDNFEFMLSKLCETAYELLPAGDVILIPDGPKPLIFAMSLVPDFVNRNGVTCLHITRNNDYFEPVDVTATGIVHGFKLQLCYS